MVKNKTESERAASDAKTIRLRALRLAREAAESGTASEKPPARKRARRVP
jgi:hypothetical protein